MSEPKRYGLEGELSWEEWLRQGFLTAAAVARLQALARQRRGTGTESPPPRPGTNPAGEEGGAR